MNYNIALIKGDGIGPEIIDQAVCVLDAVERTFGHKFNYTELLAGGAAIDQVGVALPPETLEACKASDAVLLGAVGGDKWDHLPAELKTETALLRIRKELGLFANLRPVLLFDELAGACPLRPDIIKGGVDFVIVRELTGGIYFGERGIKDAGEWGQAAYDVEQYSEGEVRRIGVTAFELALKRRKKLTSVDKANVLESSRLWRRVITELASDYPDVELNHMYVDNTAMQIIRNPRLFDVIVTSNMFGDILSDEASMLAGSLGMLPSASLSEGSLGMYEPIHGSSPKRAGGNTANPIATILSAAMMLRLSLNLPEEADAVEKAVRAVLTAGYRTQDIWAEGMTLLGTAETGEQIASEVMRMGED
jgi:3-isopropylmalate dehydrogenase